VDWVAICTLLHLRRVVRVGPMSRSSRAVTSALIEQIIARAFAAGAVLFGALAVGSAFSGRSPMGHGWTCVCGLGLFGGLVFSAVAGITMRWVRLAATVVAVVYLLAVVSWPFAVRDVLVVQEQPPWMWPLCNLAMAAAAVGLPELFACIYVFVVAAVWVLIRLTPSGGGVGLERASLDGGYAFVLGVAVLTVILVLRRSAGHVDDAIGGAAGRYAHATREHENEKERVSVDALLHDSVLTTFLQVGRAHTDHEKRLAARMAINSLNVVATTEDHLDRLNAPVSVDEIRARFEQLRTELGVPMTLRTEGPEEHSIPFNVAETLFAATLQALINSVQHAGADATDRSVMVSWSTSKVTVTVTDDGVGFDPTAPSDRLGVRVSIIERVQAVGGTVTIDSAPGRGTTVTLTWNVLNPSERASLRVPPAATSGAAG
jgi:two-component sensor histidine kinase